MATSPIILGIHNPSILKDKKLPRITKTTGQSYTSTATYEKQGVLTNSFQHTT